MAGRGPCHVPTRKGRSGAGPASARARCTTSAAARCCGEPQRCSSRNHADREYRLTGAGRHVARHEEHCRLAVVVVVPGEARGGGAAQVQTYPVGRRQERFAWLARGAEARAVDGYVHKSASHVAQGHDSDTLGRNPRRKGGDARRERGGEDGEACARVRDCRGELRGDVHGLPCRRFCEQGARAWRPCIRVRCCKSRRRSRSAQHAEVRIAFVDFADGVIAIRERDDVAWRDSEHPALPPEPLLGRGVAVFEGVGAKGRRPDDVLDCRRRLFDTAANAGVERKQKRVHG
eukprot:6212380-Pleurochrysis_carterae.AAC.3